MIGKASRSRSFNQTLSYVLNPQKKPQIVFANLAEAYLDTQSLVTAFTNHAALPSSTNKTQKPVYHLSLSPAIEDSLTCEDWHELSRAIIKTLKLERHQAISVMHCDTFFPNSDRPRPHIHIVANVVGDDGKCANFFTIITASKVA
ncbi:relaxase/mobilization nuclease domain-containing protein [Myxosarcina sp. GI1]|uniref:relaxase/mobilization nuclease domain-containing protein n=1 Tax=Myxosarcina sp. GI1 TaxID=1541065 RepID=UPI00055A5D4D|nr:relaxase/mobilization nuclease domain-containing protein [Myxosarcina sp. GI1]